MLTWLTDNLAKRVTGAWLTMLVHLDGFRANPVVYLTAIKWWIKRKRARARAQLAPLLGQSPWAYSLWMLNQGRVERAPRPPGTPLIVALVDEGTGADAAALAQTLDSLSEEGVPAIVIGAMPASGVAAALDRIDWAKSPWLMPVAPGDRIAVGAANAYRIAMAEEEATKLLYADDDQLVGNQRRAPHFKPDWNAELFVHHDYLTGACIIRADRADLLAIAEAPDWAARLVRWAVRQGGPVHVRKLLHHRRNRPAPRLPLAPVTIAADLPPVSVIVPTRNRVDLLRTCLDGLAATDHPGMEIIIVDNDSDDLDTLAFIEALDPVRYRVLRYAGEFNYAAINNWAAQEAGGRLLCLLNNDIEVVNPDWLAILTTQALRPDVGAVGARLLYPDGRIQHAGVVIGVMEGTGHAHRLLAPEAPGYFRRHALPQYVTAVTGACLVVERDRFLTVGGFDDMRFAVAFNDVDLCLRLNRQGWQSFYEPRATLVHHESVSRGHDRDRAGRDRLAGEANALDRSWGVKNHLDIFRHPDLSVECEQFTIKI